MNLRSLPLFLLAALPLAAQAKYMPAGEGYRECPIVEEKEGNLQAGQLTSNKAVLMNEWSAHRGTRLTPKGERRDASAFAVLNADSQKRTVKDAKGKIVLVAFWETHCMPSVKQLEEVLYIQPNQDKFGLEVWPVAMDEKRWASLVPFQRANKAFFKAGAKIFTPGLGSEGPNVFLTKDIPSLPAVFILDPEGKVAAEIFGYEPKAVEQTLGRILVEEGRVPGRKP